MLNHQSPIPLYHQLADLLTPRIRTGEYAVGDRIPSEHQLVAAYGIGRPTVRQAIDVLVRRRMLVRRRGSGTYVAAADHEVDLFSLAGTTSAFQRQGLTVDTRVRQKMQVIAVAGGSDNPFDGGRAFFFSRRSCVEGSPVLIEDLYLHPELFSGIEQIALEGRSIAAIVSSTGNSSGVATNTSELNSGSVSESCIRADWLLIGPAGLGRELAAVEAAALLVCDESAEPWNENGCSKRIRDGVHPDVTAVLPMGAAQIITIKQVRKIVDDAPGRPYEGLRRVWILDGVEAGKFGDEASNAFLKVLEEPPEHVVFILLADNPTEVLPTVHFRV